jgi:hypothetical protein
MAVAIGVLGIAFSFGTTLPGYAWLHEHVPLLAGLRNAARWGWLALAAIAVLAGFGVAVIERAAGARRLAMAISLALLVTIEAIRVPVGFTPFQGIPRIYDRLAQEHHVVLAEFPFYSGSSVSDNGPYVLANTRYFQPLLNGYSGFQSQAFEERGRRLREFPGENAMVELRRAGVSHVTVHLAAFADRYGEAAVQALDRATALELVAEEDGLRLYRLIGE